MAHTGNNVFPAGPASATTASESFGVPVDTPNTHTETAQMIAQAFQTQGDMRDVLRPDVYYGAREDDACWRWLLTYDNWFDTSDKITGKDLDDTLKLCMPKDVTEARPKSGYTSFRMVSNQSVFCAIELTTNTKIYVTGTIACGKPMLLASKKNS